MGKRKPPPGYSRPNKKRQANERIRAVGMLLDAEWDPKEGCFTKLALQPDGRIGVKMFNHKGEEIFVSPMDYERIKRNAARAKSQEINRTTPKMSMLSTTSKVTSRGNK